jgi:hypothetical protein
MPNFESYCRCPGCGECSAHKQVPELEAKIRSLTAKKERLKTDNKRLLEALRDTTVNLLAAVSLLESGGKKAAASDKMFAQMLVDYTNSVERGRAVIRARVQEEE